MAKNDVLPPEQVTTVMAGVKAVALIHTETYGYTALDNRCLHQWAKGFSTRGTRLRIRP